MTTATLDIDALKSRLKATWMSGDFHRIAQSYEPGAQEFVRRLRIPAGAEVLDVACGTGNLSIPAARAGALVTGLDLAPNLLEQARARAAELGLAVRFDEGDAERLPYADASFDVVMSMFGVMFAPRPELSAAELVRVCRPGGRIALANWTPAGFIGQMFRTIGSHVPPPPSVPSPLKWGEESTIRERLAGVADLRCTPRLITFRFPMPVPEVIEFWRVFYGPTNRAFEALSGSPTRQAALRADLERLWSAHNRATDGTTLVDSGYLETIVQR